MGAVAPIICKILEQIINRDRLSAVTAVVPLNQFVWKLKAFLTTEKQSKLGFNILIDTGMFYSIHLSILNAQSKCQ